MIINYRENVDIGTNNKQYKPKLIFKCSVDRLRDAMGIIGSRMRDAIRWRDKCHPCTSVPLDKCPPGHESPRQVSPQTTVPLDTCQGDICPSIQ